MRKVILATPTYDGQVWCEYTHSLVGTIREFAKNNIELHPVWWPGEALVQHARNMLLGIAIESQADDILFADADQSWNPKDALRLIKHRVDCVGAPVRLKSDVFESYNVRAENGLALDPEHNLLLAQSVGTGFFRLTYKAMMSLWEASEPYEKGGQKARMVFDVCVFDGRLVGEDVAMCGKLTDLGFDVFLDPSFVPGHHGAKTYTGDFNEWLRRLTRQEVVASE